MIKRFVLIITVIICLTLFSGGVFASIAKSEVKTPLPTGLSKDTQFILSCLRRNWNFPQSMLAKIKL